MPIEETGERSVRTDCLNFDVSLCIQIKKQISIGGRRHGNIFLWDLRSRYSSRLHDIS